MKKSILMLLVVCAVFALSNCKKDYLVQNTGTVTGNVRDVANNNYLGKVLATVVLDKNTMLKDSTDSVGYFSISGIPAGTYAIVYSKAGYATMRTSITVYSSDAVTNTTSGSKQTENYGLYQSVQMYPLVSKVTGTATLFGVPVANATITAYVSPGNNDYSSGAISEFEPYSFTTTTNANGVYSFTNLPLLGEVTIVATSVNASATSDKSELGLASTVTPQAIDNINMTDNSLLLLNYSGKGSVLVDTTTQITLTFSENISEEITKTKGGSVKLLINGETEVLSTITYSNNQITISPISGFLTRNTPYLVSYTVYSSITKYASGAFSFKTKAPAATITTPTITYDPTNGLRVTVASTANKISGSISYELWYKSTTSSDFTLSSTFSFTTAPYQIPGTFNSGSYYVVAKATGLDGVVVRAVSSLVAKP